MDGRMPGQRSTERSLPTALISGTLLAQIELNGGAAWVKRLACR